MNERYINNCARGVDKKDMICDALTHYKSIIVGAVVGFVIMTFVGMILYNNSLNESANASANDYSTMQNDGYISYRISDIKCNNRAVSAMQELLYNSVLSREDVRYVHSSELVYQIKTSGDKKGQVNALVNAYKSILNSDDFHQKAASSVNWDVRPEFVYELINVSCDDEITDESSSAVLKITTIGPSDEYAKGLSQCVKDYIANSKEMVNSEISDYDMILVNESIHTNYTFEYANRDADIRGLMRTLTTGNGETIASFTPDQLGYVNDVIAGKDIESSDVSKTAKFSLKKAIKVKWMLVGLVGGAFVVLGFWLILYVFAKTVHTDKELEYLYSSRVFAQRNQDDFRGIQGLINRIRYSDIHFFNMEEISEIVQSIISENGYENIAVISSGSNVAEIEGCNAVLVPGALVNPASFKKLSKVKNVIVMEQLNSSRFSECVDVAKYLTDNEINVIGVVR